MKKTARERKKREGGRKRKGKKGGKVGKERVW